MNTADSKLVHDDKSYNKGNKHISKTKHKKGKLDDISPSGTQTAKRKPYVQLFLQLTRQ